MTSTPDFASKISALLRPQCEQRFTAIDLFAGCGGLALGFEAIGVQTIGFELNLDCCETYSRNLHGTCEQALLGPDFPFPDADIVIGGPPCQPFSVGGHQNGLKDARDGFPTFINAVRQIRPALWMFENVRGLLYRNRWYLDEIVEALEDLGYTVEMELLNAVDFGVPQNRERVIVVGHHGGFVFPKPVQTRTSAGEALGELAQFAPANSKFLTPSMDEYVARYEKASKCIRPRDLHLDQPARTLTCRNLAGATGDMHRVRLPDGRRRRLMIREAARLQSFPDWFEFVGEETSVMNQIGNAVPPLFAYHIATEIVRYLQLPEGARTSVARQPRQGRLALQ